MNKQKLDLEQTMSKLEKPYRNQKILKTENLVRSETTQGLVSITISIRDGN